MGGKIMTNNLTYHAGDIVLLRAEIVGVGSDGPYVRVRTGLGRATCFWAATATVAQIEHALETAHAANTRIGQP